MPAETLITAALQLLATLVSVATLMWGLGIAQEKRLLKNIDDRFNAEAQVRGSNDQHLRELFGAISSENKIMEKQLQGVQRELLMLKADLPEKYVRREDYVRGQTVIEAKLDALAVRLENTHLRSDRHV